jgi:glycosyltransferase involved in cell wall biosynthesis
MKERPDTIQSVISQDYPNIEYIVLDGGSTDSTLDIIKKYEDRITRWVSGPDEGISDAMNKGIGMASGDIIGIIHSDDYYADSTAVGRVVEAFGLSKDIKVVYGILDYIDPVTGKVIFQWGREAEPQSLRKSMYMPHPTIFCKREVYDAVGLFRKDYRFAMDYEWALRVVKYTRPHFINYRLARMRFMGTSGKHHRATSFELARSLKDNGYYYDYVLTVLKNCIKLPMLKLGFEGLVYKYWARKIKPK